jgi:predicted PurR-regulated permease PerM
MESTPPTGVTGDALVPDWLRWLAAIGWRVLATVLVGLVALYFAVRLATVTVSVLVAIIIAATFAPYVLGLRARGWSRTRSAAVVTVGAVLVIVGTLLVITVALVPYVAQLPDAIRQALDHLRTDLAAASVPPEVNDAFDSAVTGLQDWLATQVEAIVSAAAAAATVGVLAVFLVFFLLQDGDRGWGWVVGETDEWRRTRITEAGRDAIQRVGGYLRGTAILASTDAVSDFIFLYLLGVPLAAPLAVLVFFAGFIPYIGGFFATIVLVLMTLASSGPQAVILLLVGITIMNVIQGNLLAPVIYGKSVDLHPAVVLAALPAGAAVAGIVGLFAAIPVVAFVVAVANAVVDILDVGPTEQTAAAAAPGGIPEWLDRLGQWSWRLLVGAGLVGLAVGAAVQVPTVVGPLTLAIILAATFLPTVRGLERRGWRRGPAALVVTLGAWALVVIVLIVSIVALVPPATQMIQTADLGGSRIGDWASSVSDGFGSALIAALGELVSGLAALGVGLVLAALMSFYVLKDGNRGWAAITGKLAGWRRREVDAAGQRAVDILGGYMVSTGVLSAFGAATQYLIMVVLGLPLALPVMVLSFIGGFIPYIGSALTTLLALLIAIAVGSPQAIAVMFVWTVVFNIVQGSFIAPLVYGRAVSLHPAIVLLAIPAGGELAGIVGMFLAVPFLGVVAATWRTILDVMGEPPPETAPEPGLAAAAAEPARAGPAATGADA